MKYLVLLVVLVVVIGWLRAGRRKPPPAVPPAAAPRTGIGPPQPMVRCAHCGLHLPFADALTAGRDSFCSAEHQRAAAAGP